MNDSLLRPVIASDLPILLEFIRGYYEFDHFDYDAAESRRAVQGLLANPDYGRLWLVIENDVPAGYLSVTFGYSLEFRGRDSFVDEFFLIESARGHGLGKRALSEAFAEIRAIGIRAIHLEVEHHNERAKALYRQLGFEPRERFLIMSKELQALK